MLEQLFQIDPSVRDESWRQRFYGAIPNAALAQRDPPVQKGPDTFPYLQLELASARRPAPDVTVAGLLDPALDQGFGMAIFDAAPSSGPQWVFTYGDLLAYSLYGSFDGDSPEPAPASSGPRQVLIASPSESFLPARARRVLARFMHAVYRVPQPKVCMVVDPQLRPSRNIMLNLKAEDYHGDQEKLRSAMRYLTWFIPRTHGLLAQPGNWDESRFVPL